MVVSLTATPDPNYEIKAWTGTDYNLSTEPNNTVTINGNDAFVTVEFMPSRPVSQLVLGAIVLCDVNGTEDSNYATLQDAIDAVDYYTRTGEDDTNEPNAALIIIADGTYTGAGNYDLNLKNNLDPNDVRNITIQSEYGPDYCIIDCNGQGRGFIFSGGEDANNYVIDGFTIANGYADVGGGIYCDGASPKITNCKIIDNTSGGDGGGIYCMNASPVITNTEISGNNSGHFGGAVYCQGVDAESVPEFINCLVTGNSSDDIGGSFYLYLSPAIIKLCTIANNIGLDNGERDDDDELLGPKGGICAREAEPEISTCIIWNNGDDLYGGAEGEGLDTDYSCIQDDISTGGGENNIHDNPLFTSGGLGDYYLSQNGAGSAAGSPCINTGDQYMLVDYQQPWPTGYDLGFATTDIQNNTDLGNTDMGYHYPFYAGRPILYQLNISLTGNGTITPAPGLYYELPGTVVQLDAYPDPNYWGYWAGTYDDTSFNTRNYVIMYSDRNASVSFEFIEGKKLYVPLTGEYPYEYSTIQAAIDAARYRDTIILQKVGSPYRTSEGYSIVNSKAITITSEKPD
ncbi:MAG: hypothetical protein KAI59_05030, partial [Planctomycetes bacterium]|nr:hypothetical protein [Planctomycetota bacterium]